MAMTKRCIVSFDMKFVASTQDVEDFTKHVLKLSKKFMDGEKLEGRDLELARVAAQCGIESALELSIKMSIASFIKSEMVEPQVSVGNIRVGFKA